MTRDAGRRPERRRAARNACGGAGTRDVRTERRGAKGVTGGEPPA